VISLHVRRLELSVEALSIDPELMKGYTIAAKLYHDSPNLTDAEPILEASLDVTVQGASTSDRMAGSKADWHRGTSQVGQNKTDCLLICVFS